MNYFNAFIVAVALWMPAGLSAAGHDFQTVEQAIVALEGKLSARIGVTVLEVKTGEQWNYKGDERFPLTSTFKTLALSIDQILIPCAIKSLAARKPSSLLCRASQPFQRAPQLAIPVRLLSIKPPSLAIAM